MAQKPGGGGFFVPVVMGLAVAVGLVYFFGADELVASLQRSAGDWGQGLVNRLGR